MIHTTLYRIINFILRNYQNQKETALNLMYSKLLKCQIKVTGLCELRMDGSWHIGSGLYLRSKDYNRIEISVFPDGFLRIGNNVFLNQGAKSEIIIGNNVLVGDDVIIIDSDFHEVGNSLSKSVPINIEDDVWIASRSIILKGVKIGKNSVVAAGSVVTKDVPPNTLVGGNAARVIRDFE